MTEHVTPDGVYNDMGNRYPSVDHVVVNSEQYTWGGLMSALAERTAQQKMLDDRAETIRKQNQRYVEFQNRVHSAIAELVEEGDLERSTANETLDNLGLDRLAVEYEVEVVVSATLLVESTLDEDDLHDALRQSTFELSSDEYGVDFSVEDTRSIDVDIRTINEA